MQIKLQILDQNFNSLALNANYIFTCITDIFSIVFCNSNNNQNN